jgi:tetratricopeptide (TPR) repeat protein
MSDEGYLKSQNWRRAVVAGLAAMVVLLASIWLIPINRSASAKVEKRESDSSPASQNSQQASAAISIDYPENGSIFPPGITPPTFIWRDVAATSWQIGISFADKAPALHARSIGVRMHTGAIDPQCVAPSNELPKLTPQQAASWTWTPNPATWAAMQVHSTGQPATFTITGYRNGKIVSAPSRIAFSTSKDPVGAPIFYRDVPLMPTEGVNGIVQPLPESAIHLIKWRLRDIRQGESRTVLHDMPTCANCHSFSAHGTTMGIDIDGPANNKGLYAIVPIQRRISIQNKDIVKWNTDGQVGKTRVGFMSQVSPDGRFVVSTFAGPSLDVPSTYYVTNFKDYKFLQVFYPTRGILEWYNRATGLRQPLPGADDPHYVQTDGVWSPDGKTIVFARAVARNPREENQKPALFANDPNETQIQYDLYRVHFNNGKGGTPERIVGASENGMSNNFPKVSPDGRWIVFVQCHNGQLMRPDSQLYIVPFNGGVARRLRANTPIMNSWHSFSPNGRWLVFSSKARSPYTQMYLTHIDANGNDSPAILIDNATAGNRAVNLPEFVNIAGDGIEDIQVPAVDVYKLIDLAVQLENRKEYAQALTVWRQALKLDPDDAKGHNDLGVNLYFLGDTKEAFEQLRQAIHINPQLVEGHYNLGRFLLQQGHPDQALPELESTVTLSPRFSSGQEALASAYVALGKQDEALDLWRKVLTFQPNSVPALVGAAQILSTTADAGLRNGNEAVALSSKANDLTSGANPSVLDTLGEAYAEAGQFSQALSYANRALDLAVAKRDDAMAAAIRSRIELYRNNLAYRN